MGTGLRSAVTVGRRRELATVHRLVDGVRRGHGGVLLVLGEAGIGKSRLLAEAAARARDGGLAVLSGRAVPGGGTYRAVAAALVGQLRDDLPAEPAELRPYRAALGRLIPGWAAGAEQPEASIDPALVLGEGLLRLLRLLGGRTGCLLVLEDAHWADLDTLVLVEYLAGAAPDWPVLVAVSARDDQSVPAALSRLAARADVHTLRLDRLGPAEVAALAAHCAGGVPVSAAVSRFLVERSEGLPFLVEELLAGVVESGTAADPEAAAVPVPPTLAGLVAERLAALTPDQRRVLEAAAVLGADPDWTVLGPVTGLPEETVLDALRSAGPHLLVPAGDRLGWRHALTRDALLVTVPPPERAALARRAAGVLRRRGRPEDVAHAAELLAAAGDRGEAARLWLVLARHDLAAGALHSAGDLLARASATRALRPAVVIERVRLLTLRGEVPAALEAGAEALAEAGGDEHAELCLQLADAAVAGGRWRDAQGYLERAGRPDDARSVVLAAEAAFGGGDPARAADLAAAAVDRAEQAGRREPLCQALLVLGRCAIRGDPPAADAAFRRAAQLAAEDGLPRWRVAALLGLVTVDMLDRSTSPALVEARELALDAGLLAQVVAADLFIVDCAGTVDGYRAAEAAARRTAEQAGRLRLSAFQALAELFVAAGRAAAGDVPAMEVMLDAAVARPHASVEVAVAAAMIRGLPCLLAHDLPGASAHLDAGMVRLAGHGSAAPLPYYGLWALLRTAIDDRDAEARDLLRRSPAALRAINRGGLQYADAVAAGRAGRPAEAAALLAAGDQTLHDVHWWRRLLRLLVLEAAVADGWGDPVPALRADLAAFEHGGEHQLARTCRDLLRRAGAPTRRGRGRTPVPVGLRALGVTSREMDVLVLVAEGLTNRQVAERLFLSRRTVDTHLTNLLAKTGAATRSELRALVAAQTR